MITLQTVLNQLTGNDTVPALETFLAEHFEDFAIAQGRYINAIAALEESLGDSVSISARDERAAIAQQTASDLLFSGLLGFKANWDHFIDPVARTFLEVDSELYLREAMAHMLPEYIRAQEIRNQFYAQLSPTQQKLYEDVVAYACYLETVAPKLAHYYGYILGNEVLQRVFPGYHPDLRLTQQYTATLENYFGVSFAPTTTDLL